MHVNCLLIEIMRYLFLPLTLVLCLCAVTTWARKHKRNKMKHTFKIEVMKGFPSTENGIEKGVSAPFGGVVNDYLIMAGGCNFPDKPVFEGGKKHYYKGGYAANVAQGNCLSWTKVGELPVEAGCGVSIPSPKGIYMIGGNNLEGSLKDAYEMLFDSQTMSVQFNKLPSLPCTLDNMTGSIVNNHIVVAGGVADGAPSLKVLTLNLSDVNSGWVEVTTLPSSPRVQPVCAAIDNKFQLWGGFYDGSKGGDPVVYTEGLQFDLTKKEWQQLGFIGKDEAHSLTTVGAAAVQLNANEVLLTGGVNKDIFFDAISGAYKMVEKQNYLKQPVEWYRFNGTLMLFNAKTNSWTETNLSSPHLARAGALMVRANNAIYYLGGELKPGVRSAEVSKITWE